MCFQAGKKQNPTFTFQSTNLEHKRHKTLNLATVPQEYPSHQSKNKFKNLKPGLCNIHSLQY